MGWRGDTQHPRMGVGVLLRHTPPLSKTRLGLRWTWGNAGFPCKNITVDTVDLCTTPTTLWTTPSTLGTTPTTLGTTPSTLGTTLGTRGTTP